MKETRKIDSLYNWEENPRTIDKKPYEDLKYKIKKFGQFKPVICTPQGEVIGGNMRLRAYKDLGITDVWVSVVEPKTDAEKLEIAIADNESAGRNDELKLAELIEKYKSEFDIDKYAVDLGKSTSLQDLINQYGPEPVEDEVPEVTENPVSKRGEVYQLGRHRIMCGDSTKIEDVEKLMDGKKADMVFTDPPYGVSYTGGLQFKKTGVVKDNQEMIEGDETAEIYSKVIPILADFCNGACYTWFAGTKAKSIYEAIESVGDIHALIIWVKNGGFGALNANYKQKHEPCLYWCAKGKRLNFTGATTETTIWNIDKDGLNKLHPTQKPVALAHKAIMNHSAGLVLDLFLGSGSTLIACEQTNRICYGMEIDPKYIDVIRKRYAKFIGEEDWERATPKID